MSAQENKNIIKELMSDYAATGRTRELYHFIQGAIDRPLIEMVLKRTEGNQLKAAIILGINRNTLHSKIKKLSIDVTRFKQY